MLTYNNIKTCPNSSLNIFEYPGLGDNSDTALKNPAKPPNNHQQVGPPRPWTGIIRQGMGRGSLHGCNESGGFSQPPNAAGRTLKTRRIEAA